MPFPGCCGCISINLLLTLQHLTELLCCDTCPNAYHPRCLGIADDLTETNTWSCPVCVNSRTDSCRSPLRSPKKVANETVGASPQKPEQLFSAK